MYVTAVIHTSVFYPLPHPHIRLLPIALTTPDGGRKMWYTRTNCRTWSIRRVSV